MERVLVEQSIRNHMPLPPKVENAPELTQGLSFFYHVFMDLTTTRPLTDISEGPISWLALDAYCRHHKITGLQREDVEFVIPQMDHAYMKKCVELRKLARAQPPP